MEIAQLLPDDKFSDAAYKQFERASPNACTYYVPKPNKHEQLKFIKTFTPKLVSIYSVRSGSFIKDLLNYNLVIVHSLSSFNIEVISKLSNYTDRPKILWIGMGYDYYDLIFNDISESYSNDTYLLTKKIQSLSRFNHVKTALKQTKFLIKNALFKTKTKEQILEYIDYFSPVLHSEYEIIKHRTKISAEYVHWNYGTNTDLYTDNNGSKVRYSEKNILLGNSATLSNNHIEILNLLRSLNVDFNQIVCPLSYGDKNYRDHIISYGNDIFNTQFKPLVDFIPLDNYYELLESCPVVIMNHIRQQAGGNISLMLYKGATVFLNKNNPFYDFYRSKGLTIFTINELEENPLLLNYRLSDEEVHLARNALKANFGMDVTIKNTLNILNISRN